MSLFSKDVLIDIYTSVTVEELSEAKAIILDLLGWGVPSDYFVNCGLTHEAIYCIFTELNLKYVFNHISADASKFLLF